MSPTARQLQHWTEMVEHHGPAIEAFAASMRRFVSLLDRTKSLSTIELLRLLEVALPELYLASRHLPESDDWFLDVDEGDEDDSSEALRSPAELALPWPYWQVVPALRQKLGAVDQYWQVFNPYGHLSTSHFTVGSHQRMMQLLSDDLGDIYVESRWLQLYDTGEIDKIREAAWNWRFSTDGHLGEHLTHAMPAVRSLIYDQEELWVDHDTFWEPLA